MISAFVKLLLACAQVSSTEMDIVSELPEEISSTIFRYLDSDSLVNVASVNREWKSICKNDVVLRKRIHKRLRKERQARIEAYMKPKKSVKIVRQQDVSTMPFGVRNGNVSVHKFPVRYEAPKLRKKSYAKPFTVSLSLDGNKTTTRVPPTLKNNYSILNQKSIRL